LAVAVAGLALGPTTVLWVEVVSWTVGVLTGLGVLVLVEQPAEAATRPTTAATKNPSPELTAS
jgi:Flp pilus assembly protein protease CpaA